MILGLLFVVLVELGISKLPLKIMKNSFDFFESPKLERQLEILGLRFIPEEEVPMSENKDYMASREEWIKKEKDWKY